ncbi:hypothetical protein BSAF29S_03887 [Bacillus safensis subsp. safensis]
MKASLPLPIQVTLPIKHLFMHMVRSKFEKSELGPIYLLVNVAGILRMGSIDQLSADDWQQTFAVNTHGVFYVSQAAPNT